MRRVPGQFWKGILSALGGLAAALSSAHAGAEEPRQIGRVLVWGNVFTPDDAIHRFVRIQSGDTIREADLRAAEERLRASKFFRTGPGRGPSVVVTPNEVDGRFFDLVIRIEEHPWNGVAWGVSDMWSAVRARDLDAALSAMIQLKWGVEGLSHWWNERWRKERQ
jgi:hypothetical protein